jgi:hypothetical protein
MYVQSQSKTHSHVVHLFIVSFITLSYCWKFDPSTGRYHCNFPEHVQHGCYLAISAHNYCPYSNSLVPCICPQCLSNFLPISSYLKLYSHSHSAQFKLNTQTPRSLNTLSSRCQSSLYRCTVASTPFSSPNPILVLIPSTLLLLLLIFIPDKLTTQLRLLDLLPLPFPCFLAS